MLINDVNDSYAATSCSHAAKKQTNKSTHKQKQLIQLIVNLSKHTAKHAINKQISKKANKQIKQHANQAFQLLTMLPASKLLSMQTNKTKNIYTCMWMCQQPCSQPCNHENSRQSYIQPTSKLVKEISNQKISISFCRLAEQPATPAICLSS